MQDSYIDIALEAVQSKLVTLAEIMAEVLLKVRLIDARLTAVEGDLKAVKQVITAHSDPLNNHQSRINNFGLKA